MSLKILTLSGMLFPGCIIPSGNISGSGVTIITAQAYYFYI